MTHQQIRRCGWAVVYVLDLRLRGDDIIIRHSLVERNPGQTDEE